ELTELGGRAMRALNESLQKSPSLESKRRIETLLAALQGELSPSQLRELRAIQALELARTPSARKVLQAWAGGADGAHLTEEARASLPRLKHSEQLRMAP